MKKYNTTERVFKCSICGNKAVAYKKSSRKTATGHTKHLWCYKCLDRTAHIQQTKWD